MAGDDADHGDEGSDGRGVGSPTVDDSGRIVAGDRTAEGGGGDPAAAASGDASREFDWRGWVLIGWLLLAIVVVPAYLYFYPRADESLALFGLGYRTTFLVLPLVPAILLGLLAVWATTRP